MLLLKVSQAHVGQCVFPAPALTTIPTPTPAPAPAPAPAAPTPFPVLSVLSNFFFLFYSLITLIPCRLCLEENVYGQIVLNLILGSTLGSTAQQIIGMGGGSCYWCTVICALPSAHNNLPWLESLRLITEPVGGECLSRNISGQLAGIMPQAVTLTPEKIQAIKRVNKKEILIETMPILKSYKYQRKVLFRFTSLARLGYEYWAFEKDGVGSKFLGTFEKSGIDSRIYRLPNLPVLDVGIGLPVRSNIGSHVRGRVEE
ncbi:hypothetical protein LguiA_013958 [Lonicera macranthoides]